MVPGLSRETVPSVSSSRCKTSGFEELAPHGAGELRAQSVCWGDQTACRSPLGTQWGHSQEGSSALWPVPGTTPCAQYIVNHTQQVNLEMFRFDS